MKGGEELNAAERRSEIIRFLYRRKYTTISALSIKFEVSERTIRRDIDVIEESVELDRKAGRYGGGIYISKSDSNYSNYLTPSEEDLILKIIEYANKNKPYTATSEELNILKQLLITHTKHQLYFERL